MRVGHYVLRDKLGEGGMGAVFIAHDERLDREVALKILTLGSADAESRRRFRREAECATGLNHAGLVKVYDFGEADGKSYIAMERVMGASLSDVLKDEGALPPARVLKYARQILEALEVCHTAGLLHRDLKPSNVMIDEQDQPRLLDLGLVKPVDRTMLTEEGSRLGTPRYMPPEMIVNGEVDRRGDLYQVGLILHECLTGQPVYSAPTIPDLIRKIVDVPPPPIDAPGILPELIERLVAREPAARWASCAEALEHLRRPRRSSGRNALPKAPIERSSAISRPPAGRRVALACALLGAGLAAALFARALKKPAPVPAVGAAPAAIDQSHAQPLDLQLIALPTRVRVKWRTASPVVGAASIAPGGAVVREADASLEHEVVILGLTPGLSAHVQVLAPDGTALVSQPVQLPSVRDVTYDVLDAMRVLRPSELLGELKRDFPQSISPEGQKTGRAKWSQSIARLFAQAPLERALENWREVGARVPDALDVAPEPRSLVYANLAALLDLFALLDYLKLRAPVAPEGLETPGFGVEKTLPAGLVPQWALKLGDGGAAKGRALPVLAVPWTQEPGPSHFNSDLNGFLQEKMGVASRKNLDRPPPLAPVELKRAYLGFRIAGASRIERLKLWCTGAGRKIYLATLRADDRHPVIEGYVRLDQRLLTPTEGLKVAFENRDAVWGGGGITLDYLVLYGEPGPSEGPSAPDSRPRRPENPRTRRRP